MSSHAPAPGAHYFVPQPSRHPAFAAFGLLFVILGAGQWVNGVAWGKYALAFGLVWFLGVLYQWFMDAITESQGGQYGHKVDLSFRWSMSWFIFSEVMFFGAFFTALWWARAHSVPSLSGLERLSVAASILRSARVIRPRMRKSRPCVMPRARSATIACRAASYSPRWSRVRCVQGPFSIRGSPVSSMVRATPRPVFTGASSISLASSDSITIRRFSGVSWPTNVAQSSPAFLPNGAGSSHEDTHLGRPSVAHLVRR